MILKFIVTYQRPTDLVARGSQQYRSRELFGANVTFFCPKTSMSNDKVELSSIPHSTSRECVATFVPDECASPHIDPFVSAFHHRGGTDEIDAVRSASLRSTFLPGIEQDNDAGEDTTLSLSFFEDLGDDGSIGCDDDSVIILRNNGLKLDAPLDARAVYAPAPDLSLQFNRCGLKLAPTLPLSLDINPGDRKRQRSPPSSTTTAGYIGFEANATKGSLPSHLESLKSVDPDIPTTRSSCPRAARVAHKISASFDPYSLRTTSSNDSRNDLVSSLLCIGATSSKSFLDTSVGTLGSPHSELDSSVASFGSGGDADAEIRPAFRTSPRLAEFICSSCKELYHGLSASNIFSSCRLARCPHCGENQFPTVELHSPINAFELDPSVAVLFEDTNIVHGADDDLGELELRGERHSKEVTIQAGKTHPPLSHLGDTTPPSIKLGDGKQMVLDAIFQSTLATSDECSALYNRQNLDEDASLLLTNDTAAKLLVLMTHARFCCETHLDARWADTCQNVKLMMLHVRDCPNQVTSKIIACSAIDRSAEYDCGFAWCRSVKSVSQHLLYCIDSHSCDVCFPKSLPPFYALLASENQARLRQFLSQRPLHQRDEANEAFVDAGTRECIEAGVDSVHTVCV